MGINMYIYIYVKDFHHLMGISWEIYQIWYDFWVCLEMKFYSMSIGGGSIIFWDFSLFVFRRVIVWDSQRKLFTNQFIPNLLHFGRKFCFQQLRLVIFDTRQYGIWYATIWWYQPCWLHPTNIDGAMSWGLQDDHFPRKLVILRVELFRRGLVKSHRLIVKPWPFGKLTENCGKSSFW